jgi:hypothetical protein
MPERAGLPLGVLLIWDSSMSSLDMHRAVQRPAYFSRVTKVSWVIGAVSRMTNGTAYSILTLAASMKSWVQ